MRDSDSFDTWNRATNEFGIRWLSKVKVSQQLPVPKFRIGYVGYSAYQISQCDCSSHLLNCTCLAQKKS